MKSHLNSVLFSYLTCAIVVYGYWLSSAVSFILGPFYLLGIIVFASRLICKLRHSRDVHYIFARYSVDWIRYLYRLKIVRLHLILTYYVAAIGVLSLARTILRVTMTTMYLYRDALISDTHRMVDDFTLERCRFLLSMQDAPSVCPALDPDIEILYE